MSAQSMQALAVGQERRMQRSYDRAAVAGLPRLAGLAKLVDLLDRIAEDEPCPKHLATLTVLDWLCWADRVGPQIATRQLRRVTAAPRLAVSGMTVGQLTRREAEVLACFITDWIEAAE